MPKTPKRLQHRVDNASKARSTLKKFRVEMKDEMPPPSGASTSNAPMIDTVDGRARSISTDPTDEDPTFDPDE